MYDFEYIPYDENNGKRYLIIIKVYKSSKLPMVVKEDKGNLLAMLEFGRKFIMSNTKTGFIKKGVGRYRLSYNKVYQFYYNMKAPYRQQDMYHKNRFFT